MTLHIQHLTRRYPGLTALDDVSLQAQPGEFLALLGPSGSGKTTLLRILAGLDDPDDGRVDLDGTDFLAAPAQRRGVGLVFQNYALFAHLTVAENVAFGLRVRPRRSRPPRVDIAARVRELLARVQLDGLGARYPSQLSGGQRQRVALARALAVEPKMLLLDEPFGALDAQVRVQLRRWLRTLHEELGLTTILVTHDQEEALELSDRIAVMQAGRIEQVGTPDTVYRRPATSFVSQFIGRVNRIVLQPHGEVLAAADMRFHGAPAWATEHGCVACVRPEQLDISLQAPAPATAWQGHLRHVYMAGGVAHLDVYIDAIGQALEVDIGGDVLQRLDLAAGCRLWVAPRMAVMFPHPQQAGDVPRSWYWSALADASAA